MLMPEFGDLMIRTFLIAAILIFAIGSLCSALPGPPSITKMGNGLTIILREDHATELIGLDIWVKAGSANETAKNNGVSHFIEHMVFGATAKRQPGDMDLEMESLGATLDARTSRDWAHFYTTVSSRYLSQALDILADALTSSQFREKDIKSERMIILDEVAKKQSEPFRVCQDYLAKELFGNHPYSLPVEGTAESLKAISRQDILDYYHKYYVPKNIAVILVGDVDMQRATTEVGRAFQGLSNLPQPELQTQQVAQIERQVNKRIKVSFNNTYLAVGFIGPAGTDYTDVCATDLLLAYLGYGYRSWMAEELQVKMGLATEVSADFLTQNQQGMISLVAETSDSSVDKFKGSLFAKIARIRNEGIPEASLALSKRSLLGQFAFQNETYLGTANTYGFYYAVSQPDFASRYVSCIQSITNQDIIRATQKYMDPSRAVVLILGPTQEAQR